MTPSPEFDWAFHLIGSVLGAGGLLILLWALFRDRSHGRRRCPRCWYDMAGTPALRCPECGAAPRSERALLRTRRHWRPAALAVAIALVGACAAAFPAYLQGWERLIPGTLLAAIAPTDDLLAPPPPPLRGLLRSTPAGITLVVPPAAPPKPPSIGERLAAETWRRMGAGGLWRWQSQWYVSRCLAKGKVKPGELLALPVAWPLNERLPGRIAGVFPGSSRLQIEVRVPGGAPPWEAVAWRSGSPVTWLGAVTRAADHVDPEFRLMLGGVPVFRGRVAIPLRARGDRTSFLERLADAEYTEKVRAALNPRLERDDRGLWYVAYDDRSADPRWAAIDFGTDFEAELLVEGEVVGRAVGAAEWGRNAAQTTERARVLWQENGQDRLERAPDGVALRITGSPHRAALGFLNDPFDKPRAACWAGSFEVPVTPSVGAS